MKLLAKLRLPSFFSATTEETHQIIRDNIRFSPLYAGAIQRPAIKHKTKWIEVEHMAILQTPFARLKEVWG